MSQGIPQSGRPSLGRAAHSELLETAIAGLGVDAFDGGGPLAIDELSDRAGHALPPILEDGRLARNGAGGSSCERVAVGPGGRADPAGGAAPGGGADDDPGRRGAEYRLIDGQQRLTTLSLVLCAPARSRKATGPPVRPAPHLMLHNEGARPFGNNLATALPLSAQRGHNATRSRMNRKCLSFKILKRQTCITALRH